MFCEVQNRWTDVSFKVENLINCLTQCRCVMCRHCKTNHCYSLCLNSVTVRWSRVWCSVVSASLMCAFDCFVVNSIDENYFLPYLVSQDLAGGNRNSTRKQGDTWKRKTREKGCWLDWWSENRVWILEVQQPTYLPCGAQQILVV